MECFSVFVYVKRICYHVSRNPVTNIDIFVGATTYERRPHFLPTAADRELAALRTQK